MTIQLDILIFSSQRIPWTKNKVMDYFYQQLRWVNNLTQPNPETVVVSIGVLLFILASTGDSFLCILRNIHAHHRCPKPLYCGLAL
jgi:hypothetical protein